MKCNVSRFYIICIFLSLIVPNSLFAQVDSTDVIIYGNSKINTLKSTAKNPIKNRNFTIDSLASQANDFDLHLSFSGSSSGYIELLSNNYPNSVWQRMDWEKLHAYIIMEANYSRQEGDFLYFDIMTKIGLVEFKATATGQEFLETFTNNYDLEYNIEHSDKEGVLKYSLEEKKITYLSMDLSPFSVSSSQKILYQNETMLVQIKFPLTDDLWFTGDYSYFPIPQPDFDLGDQFPTANYTYTPAKLEKDSTITFDASSSLDPDGGNPSMLAAQWDFGDGTTGTGKVTNHVYITPGEYEVCLTIIDIHNLRDKICKKIIVSPPLMADFTYEDVGVENNDKWVIKYKFSDNSEPGDGQTITEYLWDFGDGSEPSLKKDPEPVEHVYVKGGTYTVSLTVTNSANQTNKKTIENCVSDIGFRPDVNGWKFSNNSMDIWPKDHWEQFDYKTTFSNNEAWDRVFRDSFPPDSIFPDWFLFTETFDYAYSYIDINLSIGALKKWKAKSNKWSGSCFGFSISSLLFYANFLKLNEEINITDKLYSSIPKNTYIEQARNIINKYFLYQWDSFHHMIAEINFSNSVNETVLAIQESFNQTPNNIPIGIQVIKNKEPVGHSLVPYKIITDSININKLYIYVYDSRHKGNPEDYITINKTLGTWSYPGFTTGSRVGFYNRDPIYNYLFQPLLKSGIEFLKIEVLNSVTNDILINKNDELLGYSLDTLYQRTSFGNMIHITELYNTNPRPKGYYIDYGEYKVILDKFESTSTSISVFADTISFFYERLNTSIDQKDIVLLGQDYLKVVNSDETKKSFNFMCIFNQQEYEKVFEFNDVEISPGDTISYYFSNSSEVKMETLDSASTYIFRANILTQTNADFYPEKNVSVNGNTTQTIIPNWEDINNEGVLIKEDNGSNGTIDKTSNLNTFTGTSIFKDLLLVSVYPNPSQDKFNIECNENVSIAIISVFDMYGRQIINYQLDNQQSKWTSEFDLSQFSNGAYLLKIVTDKKVFEKILIKN